MGTAQDRDLLAALHLAEVAQRNARATGDLAKRHRLLQPEVAEDIADFLTNQDHGVLLIPSVSDAVP